MAGDLFSALSSPSTGSGTTPMTVQSVGEGEAQDDLVAFAKALKDAGIQFFGADWHAATTSQKALFQDGAKFLPFVEVTNADRSFNSVGTSEGITTMPTWEFQNGSRATGVQTLAQLSTLSGIAIPKSSTPSFETIGNQTVAIGSPLHIPVDAYDPNGNPLTISVSSSNPSLIAAEVLSGNRSLVLTTEGYGDMVFELFESEATRATSRIIQLAQSGFYNKTATNQVTFHRVIDNFVIQAGDPTGTGSGGSSLGDFDDQYDIDLQHNRTGILSYAKSSDDTNDSQFFITEGAQRNLDFNHSVFGQLVEGEAVRQGISRTSTSSSNNKPTNNITITSASIFSDAENGLIRLKAVGSQTGTATITVTVSDSEGNTVQQSFTVTVAADNKNSAPFLNDVSIPNAAPGSPVTIQLTSQDVEGDPVYYDATVPTGSQYAVNVDHSTGQVTLTPNTGYTGTMTATVGVRAATSADTVDTFDTQTISVVPAPAAPTGVDLQAASDTGSSDTDNTTNAGSLSFVISGTVSGALVELRNGSTVVGSATASGTTTTITTNNIAALGAGTYTLTATQTVGGKVSTASPSLQVIYDNVQPVQLAANTIPTTGNVGSAINVDISHAEEGSGLVYAIQNGPTGMTINATTGVLQWTPSSTQTGVENFDIVLTDKAGNSRTQSFAVTIGNAAQGRFVLKLVDASGNAITSASVNQVFKLQVFVEDIRTVSSGVFAAFADILYNSTLVEVTGTTPISHGTIYSNSPLGDTNTLGVINEFGGVSNSTSPIGEGQKLLGEISMRTKAVGQAMFNSESADGTGTEFLVYGLSNGVPTSQVNFGSIALAIGQNFVATNDTFSVNEDAANTSLDALLNDTINQGSGAVLTIQSVSTGSAGGTITIPSGGKSITYRPAANFNGSETFTYTVANQDGATQVATVTVTVQAVNDAPVAVNDTFEVVQDSTGNTILVLANDTTGPDTGETIRVSAIGTLSAGGTATITSSGNTISYSPKAGFVGTETLTYTITDGSLTATATVTITVKSKSPPPTAVADSFTVTEDAASAVFNVMANDTPSQSGETLSLTAVTATNGTVSLTSDNKINYAPKVNFAGTDIVKYTLKGSLGGSTTGTATFTVTAVNDAPTAVNDALTINSVDATSVLQVLANDSTVDSGETLTIASVTQPASGQGTVAIASDGKSIIYTPPNNNYEGTPSFSYVLSDGTSLNANATVNLTVQSFIPRNVGGVVLTAFSDSEFYGTLQFAGMNYQNQAINKNVEVVNNAFLFSNLAPGTYQVAPQALPFRQDADTALTVQSKTTDGNSVNNTLNVGNVKSYYFDIRDFMGFAVGHSLTVAVSPGKSQAWATGSGDWKDFKTVSATMSSDAKQLTIVGKKSNDQLVQSIVNISGRNIDLRGVEGESKLIKLRMKPSELTFSNVAASTGTSSGEGEGSSNGNASVGTIMRTSSLGEGEGAMGVIDHSIEADAIDTSESGLSNDMARDEAFRQILPNMQLISPAGDQIAEDQADGSSSIDEDSTDSALSSLEDLMDDE